MGAKVGDSGPGDAVSRLDEALPSIGMLEADHEHGRRRTENLLAAFERPAGGTRRPPPSRGPGFVEYYATKAEAEAEVEMGRGTEGRKPARRAADDDATMVRQPQGRRRGVPAWLFWGAASAAMVGIGITAGILTTGDPPRAAPPTTPSAVRPAAAPATLARDEVPLPDTAPPAAAETAAEATTAAPAHPSSRARTYGSAPPRRRVDKATPPPGPEDDGPVRQL